MPFVLLAIAIVFNVAGQLLLKRAAMVGARLDAEAHKSYLSPWFFIGVTSLGVSMLLWVFVLRKLPLTLAHPFTGLVFACVPLASHILWSEPLPAVRLVGIAVIICGVLLVARG